MPLLAYLSGMENIPKSQSIFLTETINPAGVFAAFFKRNLEGLNIDPKTVKTFADLGCGNGIYVGGALIAFPAAVVHAVDYKDVLDLSLKQNSRVVFYQGLIIDLLTESKIPKCDVVLLCNIGSEHGFTKHNICLLQHIIEGLLITTGENAHLESTPWFKKAFNLLKDDTNSLGQVWQANPQ